MITGTIAEFARLTGEAERMYVVVALFGKLRHQRNENRPLQGFLLLVQHGAAEHDYLGRRIVAADGLKELAVGSLVKIRVVVVGGEVVRAEVDADHLWRPTAEVPVLGGIAEDGVSVFCRHDILVARLRAVVVAVDTDTAPRDGRVDSVEAAARLGSVGQVVVLSLVLILVRSSGALDAVAAGDGVADEFYPAVGQWLGSDEAVSVVKYEPVKFGMPLGTHPLDGIDYPDAVNRVAECGGKADDRVSLGVERHLEGFGMVYPAHEISAFGLGYHFQRGARETRANLYPGPVEHGPLGISEAEASDVLDVGIGG